MCQLCESAAAKLAQPKTYIRLNSDGEPQLVSILPVLDKIGVLDREHVAVYLDEEGPHVVTRSAAETMLIANDCKPLEEITHFKMQVH